MYFIIKYNFLRFDILLSHRLINQSIEGVKTIKTKLLHTSTISCGNILKILAQRINNYSN